jgi:seryl-tRNA synthetase
MLQVEDFIEERGGDPNRIKESQRRRGASVELVDEIVALWGIARRGEQYLQGSKQVLGTGKLTLSAERRELRGHADWQQNQQHTERDRAEEEGQGGCQRAAATEGRSGEAEEAAGGSRRPEEQW